MHWPLAKQGNSSSICACECIRMLLLGYVLFDCTLLRGTTRRTTISPILINTPSLAQATEPVDHIRGAAPFWRCGHLDSRLPGPTQSPGLWIGGLMLWFRIYPLQEAGPQIPKRQIHMQNLINGLQDTTLESKLQNPKCNQSVHMKALRKKTRHNHADCDQRAAAQDRLFQPPPAPTTACRVPPVFL